MENVALADSHRRDVWRKAAIVAPILLILGFLSGYLSQSGPGNPWFGSLQPPALYPPPATFSIVWSILYILMGISFAMILAARGAPRRYLAIGLFLVQFVLNLAWTPTFFALHRMDLALAIIAALDVLVILTILVFARIRRAAGWLLAPYLAWILFATYLNWAFIAANPGFSSGEAGPSLACLGLPLTPKTFVLQTLA